MHETEKLELKRIATNDIYKEIIAFANTDGGTLLIGIEDDGVTEYEIDINETYLQITNGVRDNISPDVTIFIKYTLDSNHVIRIDISEGSNKPYYLKAKGLKSSGVYVRQGTSSVQATSEQIRQMIKETDGDIFENFPSLNQNLNFNGCMRLFEKHGLEFDESKFVTLGFKKATTPLFTNLGFLFSDECEHSIKVAVFEDVHNTIFKDRQEFTGSILEQIDDALKYVQLNNKTRSVIDDLVRKDFPDYPKEVLREALINAVMHRDYSYSGSIIININDEFIEFISIGGLLPGISEGDIKLGVSQLRNQKLTKVFLQLNIIEAYGTGIKRIFGAYRDMPVQPQIDVGPNSFRIRIPNMNEMSTISPINGQSLNQVTSQEALILKHLEAHEFMKESCISSLLRIKRSRTLAIIKEMNDKNLIKVIGRGQDKKIFLN